MKVLVYSTFYGLPDFTSLSIKNHLSYCNAHGYDYKPDFRIKPTTRQFSWAKLLLGVQHLETKQYDAIFWMDADSLFLNQTIRIEDLLRFSEVPIHLQVMKMISLMVVTLSFGHTLKVLSSFENAGKFVK